MKLGIFVTHPIQYFAPIWRQLAESPNLDPIVHFFSDHSIRGEMDTGFGVKVAWDLPLLEGYNHKFITRHADLARPATVRLPSAAKFLRDGGFDAVMFHGYTHRFEREVRVAAANLGIKTLMRGEFTDVPPYEGRGAVKQWVRNRYLRWFYRGIDAFCYIGENAREHLCAHGVQQGKMFFSPYSVDSALFERQRLALERGSARRELGIADDACAVMFSGKLIPRKAPLLLVEALRKIRDGGKLHLIVVGDGELLAQVRTAAGDALGSHVTSPGFVNQSDLGRYFVAADLFVLPSKFETWGLVVNEAMQFGLPVIASTMVGCHRDLIIEGKTGYAFAAGDSDSLASLIARLRDRPSDRLRFGKEAREHVAKYNTQQSVEGIRTALKYLDGRL